MLYYSVTFHLEYVKGGGFDKIKVLKSSKPYPFTISTSTAPLTFVMQARRHSPGLRVQMLVGDINDLAGPNRFKRVKY